jgi:O-antigen/teichoic acid export membrane protein
MTSAIDGEGERQSLYSADLKKKTRTSILWTLVRIMSDQVFSFVIFVILARLLSPHEIGTFAIAYAFSEIGRIIATGGTVQSIARASTVTATLSDTVFWTNLGLALLMALAVLILAPIVLQWIDQSDAAQPLQALGFVMPIIALGVTHMAMRLREFGHKSLALRSVASGTIGGVAAVGAALAGWGVWSLVVQRFVAEIVNTIMSWHAFRWSPGRNFSLTQLRELAGFSANVALTQVIFALLVRAQDLIVGAMINAAAVGIYRTAWRTTEMIANGTIQSFATVALQTMSRLQDDRAGFISAYRWMISTSAFISFPALVGFGVLAPDAVPAIYGAKWVEAGQLAQIFAFMVVPFALNYFASAPLIALGRSANMRTLAIVQLVLTICLTVLAAPYGIFAVACAYVGRAYITLPMQMWYLQRSAGIPVRDMLSAVAAPFFASVIMGVAVWIVMFLIRPHISNMLVTMAVGVAAGVVIYSVTLLALSAQARSIARGQWKGHASKKPAQ